MLNRKNNGFLLAELLIAILIASVACTIAMRMPFKFIEFLRTFQIAFITDLETAKVTQLLRQDLGFATFSLMTPSDPEKKTDDKDATKKPDDRCA